MRFQVVFWLDSDKENEAFLYETLCKLKEQRNFSKTIRDGLRLILDLRAGNTTVLEELFPQFLDKYLAKHIPANLTAVAPTTPQPTVRTNSFSNTENDELEFTITPAVTQENATYNVMLSLAKLNGCLADLSSEILEYGIKNKKISNSLQKIIDERNLEKGIVPILEQKSSGGPKLMAGAGLPLPPPEDIELDFGL